MTGHRTFRHNLSRAHDTGPEMCDDCGEMTAIARLAISWAWGGETARQLCDDCLEATVEKLQEMTGLNVSVSDMNGLPQYGFGQ